MLRGAALAVVGVAIAEGVNVKHPWDLGFGVAPYRDGVYSGPFTELTPSALQVVDISDGFGAEDKLQSCNQELVFVDLDKDGDWFSYSGGLWTTGPIQLLNNCTTGGNLYPRSNGYVVGVATNPATQSDRLVVVGGSSIASRSNVYTSDDCGRSWTCSSQPQLWGASTYATLLHAPPVGFPPEQIFQLGGLISQNPLSGISVDQFSSFDGGITWNRPQCADPSVCQVDCVTVPPPPGFDPEVCTLGREGVADPFGPCAATNPDWQSCYMLPDSPAFPGALAADWDTLWLFLLPRNDGLVWRLNASLQTVGWELTTATWGGYGRKVFLKGTVPGSGCWFSTDYMAQQTYLLPGFDSSVNSMNDFATAPTPFGPWKMWQGIRSAPWQPRAAAAVSVAWGTSSAWLGSGVNFSAGLPYLPTYADAWQIDTGICLLGGNGQVCSGLAEPNLDGVYCQCPRATAGDPLCGSCTPNIAYGAWPTCNLCPANSAVLGGSPCGVGTGRGRCDPVSGCICNIGFTQPQTGCNGCAPGFWGASCAACPICSHGSCDGSGMPNGTGTCLCDAGWTGNDCSSQVPAPATAPPKGVDGGAVAAGVISGVIIASIAGVVVFVRFFRGGPAVASVLRRAASLAESGSGSSVGLLSQPPVSKSSTGTMSGSAAAARLGSSYNAVGSY